MGCGQSYAVVPSASNSASAGKSGTRPYNRVADISNLNNVKKVKPSKTSDELVKAGSKTDTNDNGDSAEKHSSCPSNCEYEFIDAYSKCYDPYKNWTHFSDTDDTSDDEDEANEQMKISSKRSQTDSGKTIAEGTTEDLALEKYTMKDMAENNDLVRIGRKIYSRSLIEKLIKVSFLYI